VEWLLLVPVGLVGLVVGSFLNVVIWRVPRGESIVRPPSHCPSCGHEVRPRDNVPVVSWLVLRGRCRDCQAPISSRYPLVELATALVFVVLALRIGLEPELPAYLYLGAIGIALAMIDIDVKRLPNAIVLPSYVVMAVLLSTAAAIEGEWDTLLRAALAGLALYAFYFLLMLVYPRGMGFGDVKLAGILGAALGWLGWGELVVGSFLAFLVGGVFGLALMVVGRAGRKSAIPFGPWMLLGALLGILWGGALADLYLDSLTG
jgi:leader peptidase (prepilin peptidase) / N-methyltransferase